MGKYDEIINEPRHISKTHPPLPMKSRAAQFAAFAALSGFEDVISETEQAALRGKAPDNSEYPASYDEFNY